MLELPTRINEHLCISSQSHKKTDGEDRRVFYCTERNLSIATSHKANIRRKIFHTLNIWSSLLMPELTEMLHVSTFSIWHLIEIITLLKPGLYNIHNYTKKIELRFKKFCRNFTDHVTWRLRGTQSDHRCHGNNLCWSSLLLNSTCKINECDFLLIILIITFISTKNDIHYNKI